MSRIGTSEPADNIDSLMPSAPSGEIEINGTPLDDVEPARQPVGHSGIEHVNPE